MPVRIYDLRSYIPGFKHRPVTGIGLYKPALNTAFQDSGEHQALRCRDVSADKLHPFHAADKYLGGKPWKRQLFDLHRVCVRRKNHVQQICGKAQTVSA